MGITPRIKLYFMSTPCLCTFAADSLGLVDVEGVCTLAATQALLATLQILRGRGCALDWYTFRAVSKAGYLDVLQWLRFPGKPEGQCEWGRSTCKYAAEEGHLEVLKWLRRLPKGRVALTNSTYCKNTY